MRPVSNHPILRALILSALTAAVPGCGSGDPGSDLRAEAPPIPGDPETNRAIQAGLDKVINEAVARYKPLKYEYDEGLLTIADQVESHLSGRAADALPRFMPGLDEAEERDHFRETIRRWEARSGQSLRAAIDPLIAEVAARKPGEAFHPDFHKRFGVVFDSFIPIEVMEARERQNRAIHAGAEALLADHRDARPEAVEQFRTILDRQYPLVPPAPEKSTR
jgi:hypothetical protein